MLVVYCHNCESFQVVLGRTGQLPVTGLQSNSVLCFGQSLLNRSASTRHPPPACFGDALQAWRSSACRRMRASAPTAAAAL